MQLLPARRTDARQRRVGWLVALSMLLNAAWILSIQAGWLTFSVLVIAALIATLVVVVVRLTRSRPSLWVEAVLLDGTMGLYLGWVPSPPSPTSPQRCPRPASLASAWERTCGRSSCWLPLEPSAWEALPFCAITTPHQLLRSIREPDLGCQRTDRA